jgi:6-phosphogluconolactonase
MQWHAANRAAAAREHVFLGGGASMEMTVKYNIEVVSDAEELAHRTMQLFVAAAHEAIEARGMFYTAISGGHTPARFFRLLADTPEAKSLPWDQIHIFWVDERYVPPDSEASNYKLAADTFLDKVSIPPANIHRIPTEYEDISEAARAYERTIREIFDLEKGEVPEFDLIVLGMGGDGHTGSLFPNSYATFDTHDLACVVYVLNGTTRNRITLTHPVLLAARRLAVLVSGSEKARTLREVLTSEPDEVRYPIHVLWPVLDKVTWIVDREAAAEIA